METLEIVKSDYELERGKPMPTLNHAFLQQGILLRIAFNYQGKFFALPELNLLIGGEKLVPDLALYAGTPRFLEHDEQFATQLPLTAVEIISPSQSIVELTAKAERYLQAGIKSCWIVLPEFKSIVLSTQVGDYQSFDRHKTLVDPATGIELELAPLFS
ncbi:hypothetical protein A0257_03755 [Hymenobacter psoromatis]|nr:hypothetical protein A0257_03755 [Hymenobacter psoromatis]